MQHNNLTSIETSQRKSQQSQTKLLRHLGSSKNFDHENSRHEQFFPLSPLANVPLPPKQHDELPALQDNSE